ncbi:hypothetical protein ABTJ88_19240, partial [Acinetobacter baumannii]
MHLDTVTRKVNAIHPIPKSFAFLLDGDGHILSHAKAELALTPVTAIAKELDATQLRELAERGGYAEAVINGADQLLYA